MDPAGLLRHRHRRFRAGVVAPDVGAYDALMSRLMADNPNVRRFTTNVALGWASAVCSYRSRTKVARFPG
jgi:hypothetical protein